MDDNYRSLKQVKVNTIRQQHRDLYWVAIWYFAAERLPYEFLIPYEEKALSNDFYRDYMTVKRQMFFDEYVQYYGLDYFTKRVKDFMKKQEKPEPDPKENNPNNDDGAKKEEAGAEAANEEAETKSKKSEELVDLQNSDQVIINNDFLNENQAPARLKREGAHEKERRLKKRDRQRAAAEKIKQSRNKSK